MVNKKYKKSVFIFTRDLRLEDNTGLLASLSDSEITIPIFIFNPIQLSDKNKYKSNNCIQFMIESLNDLNSELNKHDSRLFYFYDAPETIIEKLLKSDPDIDAIYINMDYTPFARERLHLISTVCQKYNKQCLEYEDYMLTGVKSVLKSDNTPYQKFTPYSRAAQKTKVREPVKNNNKKTAYVKKSKTYPFEHKSDIKKFYTENNEIAVRGGRSNALKILAKLSQFKSYAKTRDIPSISTTTLSAYLKFNTVSVREVWTKFQKVLTKNTKLITQLYWRDFYMMIVYHFPHVIGNPMKLNYHIKWETNATALNAWKTGKTGIPIVDAGMRQLNKTGYMHNRCRMIVANFLVKILHINWQDGEKYFAQMLVDYDPPNNNGGWQWSSSTGADSQPYFRIFNPWRQAEKFDPDAIYIKKYIPELADVSAKDILEWNTSYELYPKVKYPKPIVMDIKKEASKSIKAYNHRH
jgi:deoxyribodipyrimidine photo-lyase